MSSLFNFLLKILIVVGIVYAFYVCFIESGTINLDFLGGLFK